MNTDNKDKKLLAICDLSKTTWCIGEMLYFQIETLMNRIKHGVDKIDIVWLYNPEHPAISKAMRIGRITKENSAMLLKELMPLGYVNPHFGSFAVMGFKDLEELVKDNSDRYIIDPTMEVIRKGQRTYKAILSKVIDFHKERGFLPLLSCRPDTVLWASRFLKKLGGYPVVMQFRRNPFGGSRKMSNSPLNAWLKFFEECQKPGKLEKIKFIIVSRKEEITKGFEKAVKQRRLANIIFSKKHGRRGEHSTTVEQDCALIQASKICLGSSGIMMMAQCCGVPYLFFNPNVLSYKGKLNASRQLPFATPFQRLVWAPAKRKTIMKEFSKLYDQVNEAKTLGG